MGKIMRAAAVQMDVALAEVRANAAKVTERLQKAAGLGAKLVVFPECALTGYCFTSAAEAMPVALAAREAVPQLEGVCRSLGVTAVVGTLTVDADGLYNAALVISPEAGVMREYRKCHLPFLGVDKYTAKGGSLEVVETAAGRLGTVICYDVRFPEATRTLALRGAEVICVPTNWPQGADSAPEFLTRARALENRVWLVACNRVGVERGFTFIGRSQIVDPNGRVVAEAGTGEEIITAELDLGLAHAKRLIIRPGEFEMDLFGDRRPEIYA